MSDILLFCRGPLKPHITHFQCLTVLINVMVYDGSLKEIKQNQKKKGEGEREGKGREKMWEEWREDMKNTPHTTHSCLRRGLCGNMRYFAQSSARLMFFFSLKKEHFLLFSTHLPTRQR